MAIPAGRDGFHAPAVHCYSWPRSPLGLNRRNKVDDNDQGKGATEALLAEETGTVSFMRPRSRPPIKSGILPSSTQHDGDQSV